MSGRKKNRERNLQNGKQKYEQNPAAGHIRCPWVCFSLQLKALFDSMKDENTLLLDNGDVLEGSPLSFYHYHYHADEVSPMTRVMKKIGYDYINVGNHDFNYGEKALKTHLKETDAECITSNWLYEGKPFGNGYVIRDFGKTRIALFGLVTDYIPHWEAEANIRESVFTDVIETAERTVRKIQENEHPSYIVCMYHGGMEKDPATGIATEDLTGENVAYELLEKVRGIDILLGGHQHRTLSGRLFDTVFVQTRDRGCEIGCVDIYPEEDRIEVSVVPCDLPADTSIEECAGKEENECQKWLDLPLGRTAVDLSVKDEEDARLHKSQLITFLNQVAMDVAGSDLSANALFLHATGFPPEITMRNLVSTYVYPNTLVVKKISGKILRAYLEKDAEFFAMKEDGTIGVAKKYVEPKPQQYNYDMLDGIDYTIQVSKPVGKRIVSLLYHGVPVKDEDTFTIALNNYRASGGGNYDMLKDAETVKEISNGMVEMIAEYILKKKVIDFEPVDNIHVIA